MTEPLPLTLVDAALRGRLIALLLLLAGMLGRDRPRLPAAWAGVALTLGLCVQVLSSTPLFEALVPRLWQAPLVAVSVGNAVLFWVFVQALFYDDFALRPVHGVAWLAVASLSGLNCAVMAGSASVLAPLTLGAQRAAPLLFSVLAAVAAARHWHSDLVEGRRRLRVFVVVTGIAYSLVMLVARLAAPQGRLSGTTATLDVLALLVIVAVVAWQMLHLASSDLLPARLPSMLPSLLTSSLTSSLTSAPVDAAAPSPVSAGVRAGPDLTQSALVADLPAPANPAEERLATTLQRVMAEDRAYRTEDLTVAGLAARLAVPEYRLRRLINQRLGHRNFNAFVNGYRLDEARTALADPARRELPVLTIALDAGFQSIGPFNRAFKTATGLTPTEFRREKLADS